MKTRSWKTTIGGAIGQTGTAMVGVGVLSQLSQLSPSSNVLSSHQLATMWYVALTGYVLSCVGKGVTAFFAADASALKAVQRQMEAVPPAIENQDTSFLRKTISETRTEAEGKLKP